MKISSYFFAIIFLASFGKIYSQSSEYEDIQARAAWEKMRLADPATGQIPEGMRAKELAFTSTLLSDADFRTTQTLIFDQRGPWNVGGRTRAFAVDVNNENIMFAGGVSGGLWRSTDAGTTWTRITPSTFYPGINYILQDTRPGHTDTWYASTGEAYGTSASADGAFYLGAGLLKSIDNGLTWNFITSTTSNTPTVFDNLWEATWNIALNSADTTNDVIYSAILGTIKRSTDGGTSWTNARGGSLSAYAYFTNVMTTPSGVIYATLSSDGPSGGVAQHAGIWRSTDGITWASINPPFIPAHWGRIVSAYVPQNENMIYFLAANTDTVGKRTTNFQGDVEWNSFWKYTYLSGDGSGAGGAWTDLSVNLPATGGGTFSKWNVQGGYDLIVAVSPADSNFVLIGGTNIFRSTTAFLDSLNTTHIAGYDTNAPPPDIHLAIYANQHPDQHFIFFKPNDPQTVYSANDGGVWRTDSISEPYVHWNTLNNGYLTTQFYTVTLDHGNPFSNVIIGGLQDNGTYFTNSISQTSPWVMPSTGDGSYCAIKDGDSIIYTSKQLGKIYKTIIDANGNLVTWNRIDPIGAKDYLFINPFVLDPSDLNRMYLPAGNRMWRNDDLSGIPFSEINDSISTNWFQFPDSVPANITAVAISSAPPGRLYFGTENKFIYRVDDPETANPTLTYISSAAMPNGSVSCLAVDPSNADNVIAVFSNYNVYSLWNTTDGGTTWTKCAGNLEQFVGGSGNGPSCRWATIMPRPSGNAYLVGTSTGLYMTAALNGTSTVWVRQGEATLGNMIVDMMDCRLSDGKLVIATHGYGVWSTTISDITQTESPGFDPKMKVEVYPNPLTDESVISITMKEPSIVSIQLFDELGRPIKKIAEGLSVNHEAKISLGKLNLSAGVYYCEVKAKDYSKVVSLVVGE